MEKCKRKIISHKLKNNLNKMKQPTTREKLIDAILDLSGDEFESNYSFVKLAKESEDELIDRLINIADYYQEQANN